MLPAVLNLANGTYLMFWNIYIYIFPKIDVGDFILKEFSLLEAYYKRKHMAEFFLEKGQSYVLDL